MAGEKILCVDDEDAIRKLCTVYLAKRGYRVEAVANGVEALRLVESKGPPDLVVTDVNMPLMNGLELVKRLREDRRTARTPIIVLSASKQEQDILAGYSHGADDYIGKPIDLAVLAAKIETILRQTRGVAEVIAAPRKLAVVIAFAHGKGGVGATTLASLDVTDIVCVVTAPHLAALRSTSDTLAMLTRIGISDERILVTLVRNTPKGIDDAGVAKFLKRKADVVVPYAEKADAAADLGVPYVLAEPNDKIAVSLRQLAVRLATRKAVPA